MENPGRCLVVLYRNLEILNTKLYQKIFDLGLHCEAMLVILIISASLPTEHLNRTH